MVQRYGEEPLSCVWSSYPRSHPGWQQWKPLRREALHNVYILWASRWWVSWKLLGAGANVLLYCLLKSFSLVDASALAPFRYTELMWSAAVGFLVFGEIPAVSTLIGAAVIIPSTLYVVWAENQKSEE